MPERAICSRGSGRVILRPGYLRLVQEQLARYLAILGLGGGAGARLAAGQFHDVVLAGEVAYRFPATRNPGAGFPPRSPCWPR